MTVNRTCSTGEGHRHCNSPSLLICRSVASILLLLQTGLTETLDLGDGGDADGCCGVDVSANGDGAGGVLSLFSGSVKEHRSGAEMRPPEIASDACSCWLGTKREGCAESSTVSEELTAETLSKSYIDLCSVHKHGGGE